MSNLAEPAPKVEEAVAEKAEYEDPALAERVQQSEPVFITPAPTVDPALPYDDPMRYAPGIVANPTKLKPNALSVNVLRGQTGSQFESYAAISRGAPEKNFLKKALPFIFDERDFATYGEMKKYCLIKGDTCFIYAEETDPKPLYAIPLIDVYPIIEDRTRPDKMSITISPEPLTNLSRKGMVTVLLKYRSNNKQAYQFTFDTESGNDPNIAKRFFDVVDSISNNNNNNKTNTNNHATAVTASAVQANVLGQEAQKAQPMI